MKKFLILLMVMFSLPVFASEYEKAISQGGNIFLYFYSPTCTSCDKFNPTYYDIQKNHKEFKYVKINVESNEGIRLIRKYHGYYIPFLIITNPKLHKTVSIPTVCAMNDMCLERVIKSFNK